MKKQGKVHMRYLLLLILILGTFTEASIFDKNSTHSEPVGVPLSQTSKDIKLGDKPADVLYGELSPERAGFRVANTELGALNISLWTYARYINSTGLDPISFDDFGNEQDVTTRNDIQLSKITLQFKGWVFDEKLHYLVYVWQNNNNWGNDSSSAFAGNLQYLFSNRLKAGAGIVGLPSSRAMEGSHPRLNRVDVRNMAEEYFRASYSSGVWLEGAPFGNDMYFRSVLANNLNQIGVDFSKMDNTIDTWSTGIWWNVMGKYAGKGMAWSGGNYGDFENHQNVAIRMGVHYTTSGETAQGQPGVDAILNSQIRLSDGRLIFKSPEVFNSALLDKLHYQLLSADAGVKYRGFALEGEFFYRRLDDFQFLGAAPALSFDSLTDTGVSIQPSYMLIDETLQAYLAASKIWGDYGEPWDTSIGVNYFPFGATNKQYGRQVRFNGDAMYTENSAIGNGSIPYSVGGTGWTFSLSAELWF
jgi:hypothetical protein